MSSLPTCEFGDCENQPELVQKFSDINIKICMEHRVQVYEMAANYSAEWYRACTAITLRFIAEIKKGGK